MQSRGLVHTVATFVVRRGSGHKRWRRHNIPLILRLTKDERYAFARPSAFAGTAMPTQQRGTNA
jgi:hypothetical protein